MGQSKTARHLDQATLREEGFVQKNIYGKHDIVSCEDNKTILVYDLTDEECKHLIFNGESSVINLKANGYV